MSLRAKLLSVFALLAVLPLAALSLFDYLRSLEAVRRLIADQTAVIAERAAQQLAQRLQIVEGDLRLLAGNEETARLYQSEAGKDSASEAAARKQARRYFDEAWRVIGGNFAWISFHDATGAEIDRLGIPADSADTVRDHSTTLDRLRS